MWRYSSLICPKCVHSPERTVVCNHRMFCDENTHTLYVAFERLIMSGCVYKHRWNAQTLLNTVQLNMTCRHVEAHEIRYRAFVYAHSAEMSVMLYQASEVVLCIRAWYLLFTYNHDPQTQITSGICSELDVQSVIIMVQYKACIQDRALSAMFMRNPTS